MCLINMAQTMLPLFAPLFGWTTSLEDSITIWPEQQSYVYRDTTETSESYLRVPPSDHLPQDDDDHHHRLAKSVSFSGDPTTFKKLYHNASERDRRKKMNSFYSSLRSLLPATDHTKKLSVPATVNRVLKYIPQLQEQVEGLLQKKEELLSSFSREGGLNRQETKSKTVAGKSSSAVSAIWLNDREVSLQMTPYKSHNFSLSEILLYLEENGLLLLNASSFESFGGRVFYNLHFQVEGTNRLDCEFLREKVMYLIDKRQ